VTVQIPPRERRREERERVVKWGKGVTEGRRRGAEKGGPDSTNTFLYWSRPWPIGGRNFSLFVYSPQLLFALPISMIAYQISTEIFPFAPQFYAFRKLIN
jgi:hypothetical protein